MPIVFVLIAIYGIDLGLHSLLFLPGLALVLVILSGSSFLLSVLGARFPDVRFAVDALMRLMFFMTPIFWAPGDDPLRGLIATYNPFTYLIEVMRAPLLGEVPSLLSYGVTSGLAAASVLLGVAAFNLCRNRILYWI